MIFTCPECNAAGHIDTPTNIHQDVLDFHRAIGAYVGHRLGMPPDDVQSLRIKLITEEILELFNAISNDDIVETADAIADSIYVLVGCAIAFGIDIRPVWREVHRSNLAKVGGPVDADGKQLKPEGWTPPDIAGVLGVDR
jgi:predicted HAD superfamily Cof-like phosphohydrolase